jgi:hypothetical protein
VTDQAHRYKNQRDALQSQLDLPATAEETPCPNP